MRIFILALVLSLTSCGWLKPHKVEIRQGNLISPEMRARLSVGMTQSQVKAALGTPLISDPFHSNRWDYLYQLTQQGKLVENKRLTVYFENEKLQRIEENEPAPVAH
jgi:outer membrane protein assembly factor BamE